MKHAFSTVTKVFLKVGGKMAAFWYHPYRMKSQVKLRLAMAQDAWKKEHPGEYAPGFWVFARKDVLKLGHLGNYVEYSPHFHAIASGYLLNSKEFHQMTGGWIYKKVRRDEGEELPVTHSMSQKDIERVAHYISTHTCYEWTKHSVRYVGDISYNRLARKDKHTERKPAVCPKCGAPLHEHLVNQITGELGMVCETEVMERIITWQYFKRPKKEKKKGEGTK
jgi:hypothetical protein